jgi:hypothetical protein
MHLYVSLLHVCVYLSTPLQIKLLTLFAICDPQPLCATQVHNRLRYSHLKLTCQMRHLFPHHRCLHGEKMDLSIFKWLIDFGQWSFSPWSLTPCARVFTSVDLLRRLADQQHGQKSMTRMTPMSEWGMSAVIYLLNFNVTPQTKSKSLRVQVIFPAWIGKRKSSTWTEGEGGVAAAPIIRLKMYYLNRPFRSCECVQALINPAVLGRPSACKCAVVIYTTLRDHTELKLRPRGHWLLSMICLVVNTRLPLCPGFHFCRSLRRRLWTQ